MITQTKVYALDLITRTVKKSNGDIVTLTENKVGHRHGEHVTVRDGAVISRCMYHCNLQHGIQREFMPSGEPNLLREWICLDGLYNGEVRVYQAGNVCYHRKFMVSGSDKTEEVHEQLMIPRGDRRLLNDEEKLIVNMVFNIPCF